MVGRKRFVPADRPQRYPLGSEGRSVSQIELYDNMTDPGCDYSAIAAVIGPIVASAETGPMELCDVFEKVRGWVTTSAQ